MTTTTFFPGYAVTGKRYEATAIPRRLRIDECCCCG